MQIHINRGGDQSGPYSIEEVKAYLANGTLLPKDLAWQDGMTDWVPISQLNLGTVPQAASNPPGGSFAAPCRFEFTGTAWELFKELFVGGFLLIITLSIYTPWFICRAHRWIIQRIVVKDHAGREVNLKFEGKGEELLGTYIAGFLLTIVTFGIYGFWFVIKMHKFFVDKTTGQTPDGQQVTISFMGTGGEFFKELFVGCLLTGVTFGVYAPWMMCSLNRFFIDRTKIQVSDLGQISLSFQGEGGELIVNFIKWYLLMFVTAGIYMFWLQVNMMKFIYANTEITTVSGNKLRMDFTGTGLDNFKISFIGMIFTVCTLGLYGYRFAVHLIKFQTDNLEINRAGVGTLDGTMSHA